MGVLKLIEVVFEGSVNLTGKMTVTGLNLTKKDRTVGYGSHGFQLHPVTVLHFEALQEDR
jgi:hypothetical protein